jgi:hypothetical protein
MSGISERERPSLLAPLREAEARLARIVESSLARIAERIATVQGVAISPAEHTICIAEPETPDVAVGRTFSTPWDILWFLIPITVFGPLVRRHFVKQINWEVEKHLARTAALWAGRINKAIELAAVKEESYLQDQISTFHAMLSETDSRIPAIRQALDDLRTSQVAIEGWICDESAKKEAERRNYDWGR